MYLFATLARILIGLYVFMLLLRMFVTSRDAYFNSFLSGIYRATDPVMIPVHKTFRRGPVDMAGVDYLVLIPVAVLVLISGIVTGLLAGGDIAGGIVDSLVRMVDAVFLIYVVLIMVFSVFYKHARYPNNPFIRTGFKIMEPVYVLIGKYLKPLKRSPGLAAFAIGLLLHIIFGVLMFSITVRGVPYFQEHPGTLALLALRHSLAGLLSLARFFSWVIIIGALMSWLNPDPRNPIVQLIRLMSEPINRPFRKIIPNIGGIDISPIFSILVLQLVAQTGARLLANMIVIPV